MHSLRLLKTVPLLLIYLTLASATVYGEKKTSAANQIDNNAIHCSSFEKKSVTPKHYTYKVRKVFPHRSSAFSQGLFYHQGDIFESSGNYGQSELSQINLITGDIKQTFKLEDRYFAEGLTLWNNELIQLTWKSEKVFRYSFDDFVAGNVTKNDSTVTQTINGEGWGITHNSTSLITSNGSAQLSFRDPKSFTVQSTLDVKFMGRPVKNLNELEWLNGCVLANIWQSQHIAVINPHSGDVKGLIDLSRIIRHEQKAGTRGVANGIALIPKPQAPDSATVDQSDLLITGKNWQAIYQLEIMPIAPYIQQK